MDEVTTLIGQFAAEVKHGRKDGDDSTQEVLKVVFAVMSTLHHRLSLKFINSVDEYEEITNHAKEVAVKLIDEYRHKSR